MAVEPVYNIFSLKQFDFFSNWFDKQVLFFETGVSCIKESKLPSGGMHILGIMGRESCALECNFLHQNNTHIQILQTVLHTFFFKELVERVL